MFPGVSAQSILNQALNSISPEMMIGAIVATTVAIALINNMRQPVEMEETPKKIVPIIQEPIKEEEPIEEVYSQALTCPKCNRSFENSQVIVLGPFADLELMFQQLLKPSILAL